jgi:hypothetical protein
VSITSQQVRSSRKQHLETLISFIDLPESECFPNSDSIGTAADLAGTMILICMDCLKPISIFLRLTASVPRLARWVLKPTSSVFLALCVVSPFS